jgi:hypothetical protein
MIHRLDKRHKWCKTIITSDSLYNICNSCGNITRNSLIECMLAIDRINVFSHVYSIK